MHVLTRVVLSMPTCPSLVAQPMFNPPASHMQIQHLDVQKLSSEIYSWILLDGGVEFEKDAGHSSVTECFAAGCASLPALTTLLEISYAGIHFGTFKVADVIANPAGIADEVMAQYAYLLG